MEELNQNTNEKSVPSEDRERNSEVLQRFIRMARGIDGLGGRIAEEIFNSEDESARRELINNLSHEQYCQLIIGINGILRGKEKEAWKMDGVGVTVVAQGSTEAHIFPNHPDKKEIIVKSWEGAQQMSASGRDLDEIGMLLGSILVETHPFGDGNGRTSRFVYSMVKGVYSKEKMSAILGEYGRDEVDMALCKKYIDMLFEEKHGVLNKSLNKLGISFVGIMPDGENNIPFGKVQFPEYITEETKENIIQGARNDPKIFVSGILHFFHKHPEINAEEFIKEFEGGRKTFLLQHIISGLSKEKIEELEQTYWEVKKIYTEEMIDIFVNADNPEYKIEEGGKEMRIIDLFKERIAKGEMLY